MECRELNERAVDRLTGQLIPQAERELASHLETCGACRDELAAVHRAWKFLGEDTGLDASPEFRRRGRELLEEEMLRRRVREFRPRPRARRLLAQAAAVLLAAGAGWYASASRKPAAPATPVIGETAVAPLSELGANSRLSNLSYQPSGADGRVGLGFDVTTRHTIQGSPADPEVARVLAYVLSRDGENAGEKSRAIELVVQNSRAGVSPASPDIVAALTSTLRKDPNPGVRKKAADALSGMPMTPEIRAAFLEALRADRNPAVRLVAIETLAAAAKESPDARTIQSLREKAIDPSENGFVRARAASALKTMEY
jgi:hypothetical protein